jgi:hypothetical protein
VVIKELGSALLETLEGGARKTLNVFTGRAQPLPQVRMAKPST